MKGRGMAIYGMLLTVALLTVALYVFVGGAGKAEVYKESRIAMDTIITLTVVSESRRKADAAIEAGFKEVERLEGVLSMFLPQSEVSLINDNSAIKAVNVSEDTYGLIKKAIEIAALSGGAFDPTIGPVSRLWDFQKSLRPTDAQIRSNLPLVDYHDIVLDDASRSVMLRRRGMVLDLGAIAKGYTADRVVEVLKAYGMQAGIVAIAGDIKTFGDKPDGSGWHVGIRRARDGTNASEYSGLAGVLTLRGEAVSTSGDYERFFMEGGVRYHHLLEPSTGYPARDFQSVTVVNPQGWLTDSLTTAIFVMGRDKGMALAHKLNLKVYVVYSDATTYISDNLKDSFESKAGH
ncbi:MAG: FAD:protein FMN transferase [Candidatus Magnetobacterium sp. LHC-1]|uniref:FAD:protein FMN transferase n=1 Tax=Candidatus Magnetobacterium casense TaxID=1455061 RepID=A0ABS6S122_9BACT|nr:FAD:protein FMN transferase [Candidatus Magnetobacterium casensis]MBF0608756.1 FAD:protein FMN transferase [Nitrospirota bacterium]MBV6342557.1 FAD:protein FMN transferase [Candidatus Magnetobacterium casensis]